MPSLKELIFKRDAWLGRGQLFVTGVLLQCLALLCGIRGVADIRDFTSLVSLKLLMLLGILCSGLGMGLGFMRIGRHLQMPKGNKNHPQFISYNIVLTAVASKTTLLFCSGM